jgi:hypothetical protein
VAQLIGMAFTTATCPLLLALAPGFYARHRTAVVTLVSCCKRACAMQHCSCMAHSAVAISTLWLQCCQAQAAPAPRLPTNLPAPEPC